VITRIRRVGFSAPVLLWLAVSACAHAPAGSAPAIRHTPVLPVAYIAADTAWSGDVQVDGVVHVRKGATLTIAPGTRIHFSTMKSSSFDEHEGFAGAGIRVEGRIVAVGTEESPIVFTAEGRPVVPGSWDKILFTFSDGNRFEHCVFEGARYAFHSHFSGISVRRCVFRDNEEGVRLGTSRVRIEESVFTRNLVRGINFRECRNEIVGNLVYENGDGIFLHSKSAGSTIRGNTIHRNRRFNLRLGDLHADDVDVSGNWWGSAVEAEIRKSIHDGAATPGTGTARIVPFLRSPPATRAEIRGLFTRNLLPVAGAEIRAYGSVAAGFWGEDPVASSRTDESGFVRLPVPPGRYFVVGKSASPGGTLFAFPGRNPVTVALDETAAVGLPAVLLPPSSAPSVKEAPRSSISVRTTIEGAPAAGVSVHATRPDRPDFRGPGEATAMTNADGVATLYLPPGKYLLSAKKRTTGAVFGMVDEGGLFGVYPDSPVDLSAGRAVAVEIPLFEKVGLLGANPDGEEGGPRDPGRDVSKAVAEGATRARRPAAEFPPGTIGGFLSGKITLSGRVEVTEDLLVLPGAELSLSPGAELSFARSESTKVDPEFFFGGTELVVRGTIRAEGARLDFPDRTGGVVVDGGRAELADVAISGAESGLTIAGGGAVAFRGAVTVENCRVGVALFPAKGVAWEGNGMVMARGNAVGAVRFPGAPSLPAGFRAEGSEEVDGITWEAAAVDPRGDLVPTPSPGARRIPDAFLESDRTLEGDVVIDGIVRVAPGVTLTILPGTRVFFTFRDTDGDGIGESGIFLQGNLRARGTADRPIGFYPEAGRGPGRWDSINFMASDRGENVLEHVEIAGAYRGLHAHFSRLGGRNVRIAKCYRGVQFQESEVSFTDLRIASSTSAVRCRDSDVRIDGFEASDTVSGGNFFRSRVSLSGVRTGRSGWYGFRFRESRVDLRDGGVAGSLVGVSIQDGEVSAEGMEFTGNGLAAVGVLEGNVKLKRCALNDSRVDGIGATRGNISIRGGEIARYGRHAVKLGGPAEVTLRGTNVSGGYGASPVMYFDGSVSPGLGTVRVE